MADRALPEETMLAGLRDIRLPSDAPGGLAAEVLAAVGLGLALAVVLGLALRLVTRRRARQRTHDPVTAIDALPEAAQRRALLQDLKVRAPARYAALTQSLYRPGGLPDLDTLRAEVLRHD